MIYLAFVLIIFALVLLVAWQQQQFGLREKEWALERTGLIGRIQHPEVVQVDRAIGQREASELLAKSAFVSPGPVEADDIDLVGTVQTHEPDGNGD